MKTSQHIVVSAVIDERTYQDGKWGTIEENPHTVGEWLLILEGELAEAKAAWLKASNMRPTLAEVRQVAAVAIACLEQHGVRFREHDGSLH